MLVMLLWVYIYTGQAWKICLATVGIEPTTFGILAQNRWEICLRMRYNLRGLRERDLGRVNIVIWFLSVLLAFLGRFFC
jgi:hypothetical protein